MSVKMCMPLALRAPRWAALAAGVVVAMHVAAAVAQNYPVKPIRVIMPTVAETGLPNLESGTWSGLLAPAGTPAAIIQRLNSETHRGADTREMREVMATQGGEVLWGTPEQFGKLIADEALKWAKAVEISGANTQ